MLFRPTTEDNLAAIEALLDQWNDEADRYRRAAMEVRKGMPADSLIAHSAIEARASLDETLQDIESLVDRLPAGDRRIVHLLQILVSAQALAESVERSADVLEAALVTGPAGPTHISHGYAIAAQ
jgi:hypothetical protein